MLTLQTNGVAAGLEIAGDSLIWPLVILGAVMPAGFVLGLVAGGLATSRVLFVSSLYSVAALICVLDALILRGVTPDATLPFVLMVSASVVILAAGVLALTGGRRPNADPTG